MAVFLVNGCRFKGCNLVFETLAELIQHVEETHIDIDLRSLEKQENESPLALPLSSIFRFYAGAKPKKSLIAISNVAKKSRQRNNSNISACASVRSSTPTSSEYDFDDEHFDTDIPDGVESDSDLFCAITAEQQWTNQLILSMITNKADDQEKPYVCKVRGCRRRYKNITGVKYHARHGHKREARAAKLTTKCFCGKSFGSIDELEKHTKMDHSVAVLAPSNQSGESLKMISMAVANKAVKEESQPHIPSADSKGAVSIIHPITISNGMLLATTTHKGLKAGSNGELFLTHRLPTTPIKSSASSLVTNHASLITPPNTPQKTMLSYNTISKSLIVPSEVDDKQKEINEKVAKALAAAKQAIEADAASRCSPNTNGAGKTPVTVKH